MARRISSSHAGTDTVVSSMENLENVGGLWYLISSLADPLVSSISPGRPGPHDLRRCDSLSTGRESDSVRISARGRGPRVDFTADTKPSSVDCKSAGSFLSLTGLETDSDLLLLVLISRLFGGGVVDGWALWAGTPPGNSAVFGVLCHAANGPVCASLTTVPAAEDSDAAVVVPSVLASSKALPAEIAFCTSAAIVSKAFFVLSRS